MKSEVSRRQFVKALGLGAATLAVPGCMGSRKLFEGGPTASKPNFIIIFTDDQGDGLFKLSSVPLQRYSRTAACTRLNLAGNRQVRVKDRLRYCREPKSFWFYRLLTTLRDAFSIRAAMSPAPPRGGMSLSCWCKPP